MIYQFKEFIPVIQESSFIHPLAAVTGNVIIGNDVYVGPGAAIRGDWGHIIIHDGCNIQENCIIHMFPGSKVILFPNAHIGHGAIIHGATIGNNCLVGMNAVIMDDAVLGDECIVGALTFVKANEKYENRSLIVGNPSKQIGNVTDEMIAWKTKGTQIYRDLPYDMQHFFSECKPLREIPSWYSEQEADYKPWKKK